MSSRGVDSSSAEEQLASDAWREGLDALGAGAAGCWGPSALGPPPPPPHPCNPPAAAPAGHWEPPLDALLSEDWDWSCTNLQACEPNWPGAAAPPALASADGRQRRSADPSSSSSQGAAPCPAQGSSGGASRYDRPGARERKREQQREYRARIKARADEQQARLATAEALLAQARQERHALQAEQLALQQLVQYKAEVGEAVAGHVAADAPAAAAAAAARAGDGREWEDPAWLDQLANSCLTGVPEAAIRAAQTCAAWYLRRHEEGNPLSLMGYGANFLRKLGTQLITAAEVLAVTVAERLAPRATPALLEARQRDFCSVVKSAVEEWDRNPEGRWRVELFLQMLWAFRALMFVVESIVLPAPSSTATAVQPEGCSSTACPVHPLMVQALERVEVRREQAQDILSHYRAYRERVAALREQSVGAARRMHRQAVTQGGCEAQMPQAAASMAQSYLSTFEDSVQLAGLSSEEAAAWLQLGQSCCKVLSPLQCSRLLVGVSPYLPDWLQLCALLEWQQQPSSIGCHAA